MDITDEMIAQARLLMADVGTTECLTDTQIEGYLTLNDGHIRRGAADALDAIATSEVLVSKVIRSQDLQTDGAKVADALRKHADRLRDQADADDERDGWFGFDVVYPPTGRTHPEATEWPTVTGL